MASEELLGGGSGSVSADSERIQYVSLSSCVAVGVVALATLANLRLSVPCTFVAHTHPHRVPRERTRVLTVRTGEGERGRGSQREAV